MTAGKFHDNFNPQFLTRGCLAAYLLCTLAISGERAAAAGPVTIIVNKGCFARAEEAAVGEEKVNWWDADLADDRACTECFAAMELAELFPACTLFSKNDIHIQSLDALPVSGDVILIGSRNSNPLIASRTLPKAAELTTEQSFRIYAEREGGRIVTVIEGKDRVGTLYGVYAFLEQIGMRFYGLGEHGTVRPVKRSELPHSLRVTENPSFLSRGFIGLGDRGNEDIFFWMARNRMNYCDETGKDVHFHKKLGMLLARGGHSIQSLFLNPDAEYPYNHPRFRGDEGKPQDPYPCGSDYAGDVNGDGKLTYFEAHPEWYGLRKGKRSAKLVGAGDNYCTSNQDATNELAKNLVQSLIDGAWRNVDIVNFWMLDNGKWCECECCARQGNYTDRLFDVCYAVQKAIQQAQREARLHRKVLLASLAYHETLSPPSRPLPADFDYQSFSVTFFPIERCYVHTLADPKCTEINQFLREHYEGWTTKPDRHYKGSLFIGEYYNVSSFKGLPVLFPSIMAADIPWYYRTGTRHFNYMHTPTHLWGTWTLNQYLLARLLWNVETDSEGLLTEYFRTFYPTTSQHTRAFYRHLERATANFKPFKHYAGKDRYSLRRQLTVDSREIFPLKHLRYDSYHPETDDGPDVIEIVEEMRLARKELDAALLECHDQDEAARLMEDDRRFAYGEAMVFFYYHLIRTAMLHRRGEAALARREFGMVEQYTEKLRAVTDLVAPLENRKAGDANAKDGFEATQAENVYQFFKTKYGHLSGAGR